MIWDFVGWQAVIVVVTLMVAITASLWGIFYTTTRVFAKKKDTDK